jgi:hypothetical protein
MRTGCASDAVALPALLPARRHREPRDAKRRRWRTAIAAAALTMGVTRLNDMRLPSITVLSPSGQIVWRPSG